MPPGEGRKRLRELYPTLKKFEEAIEEHKTQKALADRLGINTTTLYEHKQWLKSGKRPIVEKKKRKYMNNAELDANVRAMADNNGYAEVRVYKLTEDYKPGRRGTEGLTYLRTDISPTALSIWTKGVVTTPHG